MQLALVSWLSGGHSGEAVRPRAETHVRLAWPSEPEPPAAQGPEKDDPTLFALVSAQGFSRSAWLSLPRFEDPMTNPPEPLHWLSLASEELADDFTEFVQTNLVGEDLIASTPAPTLANPALPTPVVVADTIVRVESGLAGRALLPNLRLPRETEPILTNSVVSVLVDPSGRTMSAALLSTSGVAQADQDALNFAKAARFAPSTEGGSSISGFAFGTLVFQWAGVRWAEPVTVTVAAKQQGAP
jgi:TonB family protein